MKRIVLILLAIILLTVWVMGYASHTQNGNVLANYVRSYVIAAAVAQPYACDTNHLADIIYNDDTNDGNEAFLCYCAIAADDVTPTWMDLHNPLNTCY